RKALEDEQFVLYYQPIVNLKTFAVCGFEALIRWQHPHRGFVAPLDFIPITEETGLIVPLGRWILHTACQQLAKWLSQFPHHSLRMSVNLSVKQLDMALLEELDTILAIYAIPGHALALEITESMLVTNVETTCKVLEQIRVRGIRISIDDFGTGYSSLSYLHRLPVDALKIDRAFVSPAAADVRNQVIAESVMALSNLLELKAIAEGVETEEHIRWLQLLGCELGQGYFFSRPLPPVDMTQLLRQQTSLPVPSSLRTS
ncbi:MAG: EAL domain-containing protein, partial [Cyanothece sp. SIO2G6]|nr:EAL domain-containing protein [Cyanothece sp. SIO2G6]